MRPTFAYNVVVGLDLRLCLHVVSQCLGQAAQRRQSWKLDITFGSERGAVLMLKGSQTCLGNIVGFGDASRDGDAIALSLAGVGSVKDAVDGNLLEPRTLHMNHCVSGGNRSSGVIFSVAAPIRTITSSIGLVVVAANDGRKIEQRLPEHQLLPTIHVRALVKDGRHHGLVRDERCVLGVEARDGVLVVVKTHPSFVIQCVP